MKIIKIKVSPNRVGHLLLEPEIEWVKKASQLETDVYFQSEADVNSFLATLPLEARQSIQRGWGHLD